MRTNRVLNTINLLILEKIIPENIPAKLILIDNFIYIKNLRRNTFLCKISII
nr:MAG TPA: hypothetical protein [Caudoviricetes sp.]